MDNLKLLDSIKKTGDVKKLPSSSLVHLAKEIRQELITAVSKTGGHLASNLGVVELTIALHRVYNLPQDQIVFDVGHQCYTHKMLTGRLEGFKTLRMENGLSGFPKREESSSDSFDTGHSSTSISAALGLANANRIKGNKNKVVAVIGDGALTGGLAFEGLNNAGRYSKNFTVVLNDNKMSISKNVGAMARYLATTRTKTSYRNFKYGVKNTLSAIPLVGKSLETVASKSKKRIKRLLSNSTIFEDMGFSYLGPIDGHDIPTLINALQTARESQKPTLVHVCTLKGKGYCYAEKNPKDFHGISSFDIETGEKVLSSESYSDVFGKEMIALAKKDKNICAITAAMAAGTGLSNFASEFSSRFFDVGIAEGHAVTFASGLAANGVLPVFAVYSSFLQRSYDQLIIDSAMQKLKVTLAIDRAGFVGNDGETHQGLFDCAMLSSIPNVTVYSPTYYDELKKDLSLCLYKEKGVTAIRYPRGLEPKVKPVASKSNDSFSVYSNNQSKIAIVTYGKLFENVVWANEILQQKAIDCDIIKLNKIIPIECAAVNKAMEYDYLFFFEEGMEIGGIGQTFCLELVKRQYKGRFVLKGVDRKFISQATISSQLEKNGLSSEKIVRKILDNLT